MTLLQDIKKTRYMLEHSFSKSKKIYFAYILDNLIDIYNSLKKEQMNKDFLTYDLNELIYKHLINLTNESRKQISKNYINHLNELINNCLESFKNFNLDYQYQKKKYSFKEATDLILEFFYSFDKSLVPIIQKNLDEDHLFIVDPKSNKFQEYSGLTYYNSYSNQTYTIICNQDKFSIDDIDCIVHELGHGINFEIAKPKFFYKLLINNLSEIPSSIFEKLFINFLSDNNIDIKDAHRTNTNNLISLLENIKNIYDINSIIYKKFIESNKFDISNISSILSKYEIDYYFENIQYFFGMLLSHYYSKLYRKDPEKTRNSIYDFISNIGVMNDFDMFNHFNINQEEFINCNYLKEVIKENQKILNYIKGA